MPSASIRPVCHGPHYFPSGNPRRVRPPGICPKPARVDSDSPRRFRAFPVPSTEVLARSSRNNPVSRAVSSVASPPSQDASVSDAEAKASGAEISRGGDGPVRPEFCDISEEEDVQKRRIVVTGTGATVVCTAEEEDLRNPIGRRQEVHELPVAQGRPWDKVREISSWVSTRRTSTSRWTP